MNSVGVFIVCGLALVACAAEESEPNDPTPGTATTQTPEPAPTATTAVNCDPPYYVDATGRKRYKVDCL